MNRSKNTFYFIIRLCLLLFFFVSAAHTFFAWDELTTGVTSLLCHWFAYLQEWASLSKIVEYFINQVPALLAIGLFLQIIGALSVLFMVAPRFGATCLLLVLIPTTFVYHPFWFQIGEAYYSELITFLKNLSLIALYILVACRPYVLGQYKK
ncbi:hypothetical protein COB21_00645 [Candidatus Aerophobetes bacterium]|uniref:DoxX family protein n=1 Tax=Aerophobetes bacterium TaxID=2030807 RepID=A0A2A4X8H9_UNCAE|nr:MAG: hypothetical protein COB21_00645 [Candidatus Aerophobetes bacterium]